MTVGAASLVPAGTNDDPRRRTSGSSYQTALKEIEEIPCADIQQCGAALDQLQSCAR
ncbi:MAG: hypothetical protein M2R45_01873 [Verrucomicrobia subdivision 3 bacterium]|nr:hypothetical protein [Limisphaerales bacterium]MCS1415673.1 hypothetical protein [Limisphaerales bacterium]